MNDIAISPFPGRQTAFIEAQSIDEIGFLGMKGPGKSFTFLLDALTYIEESDYRALILRKTFTDLTDIMDKAQKIYPNLGATFNAQSHTWKFPSGATIRFGYLSHHNDLGTYIGNEIQAIYFDECGQIPLEWYKEMRSCLRTINPNIKCKTRCASNPVGAYVLDYWTRFIDTLPEGEVGYFIYDENGNDIRVDKGHPGAESRMWLRCLRVENPLLNNEEYERKLRSLPLKLQKAYLEGELVLESLPDQLIPFELITRALDRTPDQEQGWWILAIDYAGLGDDSTTFTFGRMHQVLDIKQYKKKDAPEIEALIGGYFREYKGQILVVIDAQGAGAPVYQHLCKTWKQYLQHIVGIGVASLALDNKKKQQKYGLAIKFHTTRCWHWWIARECFESNGINLSAIKKHSLLNMLMKEIGFITYSDDTGEIVVVTKKELRKTQKLAGSPDFADGLMYYILGLRLYKDRMKKVFSQHGDGWGDYKAPDKSSGDGWV